MAETAPVPAPTRAAPPPSPAAPPPTRAPARAGVLRDAGALVFEPESARVARTLREQILDGVRAPGTRLVEREVAAELGVSRIPVRDALRQLVGEGLVSQRPRSWAVVRTFTPQDVEALQEVRSALETLAFRLAAERRTPEQLAELQEAFRRQVDAARRGDGREARRAGADFHEVVVRAAGNAVLEEVSGVLGSRVRWLLAQHAEPQGMVEEHQVLLRAVRDRDPVRAARAAAMHVASSRAAARRHLA